jgi:hypothetical protein
MPFHARELDVYWLVARLFSTPRGKHSCANLTERLAPSGIKGG